MNDVLTAAGIADAARRVHAQIEPIRDELNAADRVLGDGDTGMTIANVVAAWQVALASPPADVGALLQQLGRETRRATGSSLGSVLAIGLTAAGKEAAARVAIDRDALVGMLGASADAIAGRSGAAAGDKTFLDSLIAVRAALADAAPDAALIGVAIEGATGALAAFRSREARIGRARIYGEKSIGHDDPGMLAALLLLRAAVPS
jgi:dihydroxyacetone kinase